MQRTDPVKIDEDGRRSFDLPFTAWLMDIAPDTLRLEASLNESAAQDMADLPNAWIIQAQQKRLRLADRGLADMDDIIAFYMNGGDV